MRRIQLAAFAAALAALPFPAFAATYDIDPSHSSATFSVKHLVVSTVRGEFGKLSGSLNWDEKAPAKATVEATIDVASINTRDAKRDEHLRGPDFFDAQANPTITFKSTKVTPAGKGKLKVTGDLTIRGVTRPVVLDVTGPSGEVKSPFGSTVISASGTTRINRKDFGVSWNKTLETGGLLVGEEVQVTLDVELVRKAEAKEAAK